MNAPLRPAWLSRRSDLPQHPSEQAVQVVPAAERHLWHSRFGTIVVEVREGQVYVNGEWVRPAEPEG